MIIFFGLVWFDFKKFKIDQIDLIIILTNNRSKSSKIHGPT